MKKIAAGIVALVLAFPAAAQSISLRPGESVTVRFDNNRAVVERREAAQPMTKYDEYVLWRAEAEQVPPGVLKMPPSFVRRGEGPPDPPQPLPDRVQLTLRRVPGLKPGLPDHTALMIMNGYDSKFGYHAIMHVQARVRPTDVCEIPKHFPGLEHWPYVIDELEVWDLHLDQEAAQIVCE